MAEADDESSLPWDDQTELFIRDIDATAVQKYGISARELILTPDKFEKTEDILDKIKGLRADTDSYFEEVMKDFTAENDELEEDLKKADALYNQVSQSISNKASLGRIPIIKTDGLDLSYSAPEIIYLDQLGSQVDSLVGRLVNFSNYIGDLSVSYRKYMIGSWLFSGQRSYLATVKAPDNPVLEIESSQSAIDAMLDSAGERLSGLIESK